MKKQSLGYTSTILKLKLKSQETAQNCEKRVLQKCLGITFYALTGKPLSFYKKNIIIAVPYWTVALVWIITVCYFI